MKIERKYMAHYLNAAFGKGEADYTRLGQDLEEYAPELTANVEKKSNILGQTSVVIDGYQKQGEVSPYYAEEGDPLFEKLQGIIDGPPCARNATSRSSATAAIPPATRSPSTSITPASRPRVRLTRQARNLRRHDE